MSSSKSAMRVWWLTLLVAGLAGWLICLRTGDAARLCRAVLVNFIYFAPLSAGLVTWSAVVRVSNGRWHGPLENLALAGAGFSIPSIAALAILWLSSAGAAPWGDRPDPVVGAWLQRHWLFGRDMAALAAFWGVALGYIRLRMAGRGKTTGAVLIFTYCIAFSLLGFDLVMALDPKWNSALFGGYFFMSGLYIAVAAWALMAARQPAPDRSRLHDLGRLIVAFSLITAYLMFSQLLPIWYENLPAETRFVIPRMSFFPWSGVSAVVYLGPLIMLLTIRAKRTPALIGGIAALILVGLWVERWWLVAPRFDPIPRLGLEEAAVAAAFLGALGLCVTEFRRRAPAVPETAVEP